MTAESPPRRWSLSSLLRRMSLNIRLTVLCVGLCALFIWAAALMSATVLQGQLEKLLSDQQLAETRRVASALDARLQEHTKGLALASTGLPAELNYPSLHALLAQRPYLQVVFTGGLAVIGLDGILIADYPEVPGRRGGYFGDRDYFRRVIETGRPYIDKPIIGRALKRPVLTTAVPVFDAAGRVRAVMTGITDLTAPNFLGFVSDPAQVANGEYFVMSLRDRMIVAATDPKRSMTASPERGRNLLYDRMVDGFEGSGIAVSSEGIRKLYSGVRVPTADWLILAALPTEIAFSPLQRMKRYLFIAAGLFSLLAVLAIAFTVRRILAPLQDAAHHIARMTDQEIALAPLPVQRNDEVGRLVGNFNRLLADRVKYETALSSSEQRFRLLVEGAPDAIFIQTQGCFTYANQAALTLFGARRENDLLGLPIIERIHPDYRAMIAERIKRVNISKLANPALEQVYLRLDGLPVTVEASAVPFRFGEVDGALVFARDISDKKSAAHELSLYRDHLEDLVAERTAQLAEAKQAAELAMRAKSAFLTTMSHEIRTPLTALVGLTDLLVDSSLDRQQRDCAEKIRFSAQGLRQLIDDILDFSKIEAGGLQLEQAPFSLNALLANTATVLSVGIRGKAIEALFDIGSDIPDGLVGDALRLQQILLNLTSNAVKFTDAGSIVVAVRCLDREGGKVRLRFAVRDSGIGISAEQRGQIFNEFTQADSSISRRYGGTGLGLTICARLAALMGGRIEVESELGAGCEFHFSVTLPSNGQLFPPPGERLVGLRILIVDDHPLARDILSKTCASFGWQATAVDSAAAGLDELRHSAADGRDYDLMLLDWHMPVTDGLEMLRQAQVTPGIGLPLVLLMASAFEREQLAAAMDELCFDGFVAKPMTPGMLFDAVKRAYSGDTAEFEALARPDQRLAGLRLLVADDNEINRLLMAKILQRAGAEVVLAVNGRAAVDVLRESGATYDAVLMDLQMPVMDGYTATRIIRQEVGLPDLPIIAVTAHAQPEDYAKARQLGMLGVLLKPLDVEALLSMVNKEGGARRRTGGDSRHAFVWDKQAYAELLQQLLASHADDAAKARDLAAQGDRKAAAKLMHELGGVSGFLRLTELSRLAIAAEKALLADDRETLGDLFDRVQQALRGLASQLSASDSEVKA